MQYNLHKTIFLSISHIILQVKKYWIRTWISQFQQPFLIKNDVLEINSCFAVFEERFLISPYYAKSSISYLNISSVTKKLIPFFVFCEGLYPSWACKRCHILLATINFLNFQDTFLWIRRKFHADVCFSNSLPDLYFHPWAIEFFWFA